MERYQNRPRSPGAQEDQGIPQFSGMTMLRKYQGNSYFETLLCNYCLNVMMPCGPETGPWNDQV